jgi:hypothetical protein
LEAQRQDRLPQSLVGSAIPATEFLSSCLTLSMAEATAYHRLDLRG